MRMRWSLTECHIVGGMRPAEGKAPFARGAAVLEKASDLGRFLQVRGYAGGEAEGDELDRAAWEALLSSQQAARLTKTIHAAPYAAVWILRPGFEARDKLLAAL